MSSPQDPKHPSRTRSPQGSRPSRTSCATKRYEHQTRISTALRRPNATSNAPNVVPASTRGSMRRPSFTALVWTVPSQDSTQDIQVTNSGKRAPRSERVMISTSTFLKERKGAGTKGSPPIHSFFKTTPQTTPGLRFLSEKAQMRHQPGPRRKGSTSPGRAQSCTGHETQPDTRNTARW